MHSAQRTSGCSTDTTEVKGLDFQSGTFDAQGTTKESVQKAKVEQMDGVE